MDSQHFNFNKIDNFDDHINKSIPNYDILFDSVKCLSKHFMVPKTFVYDVGCSTGKLIKTLDHPKELKIGIDNANLLPKGDEGAIWLEKDVTKEPCFANASLVISMFTIQFIPIEDRAKILKAIYDGLIPGGAFIFCEKTYSENGDFQDIMTFSYYDMKRKYFTEKEIMDKEQSLRGYLKPLTEIQNGSLLIQAGFSRIQKFWQIFNFCGYVVVKAK